MVLFLVRVLANLWFINQIDDEQTISWNRKQLRVNAAIFLILFLIVTVVLLTSSGYEVIGEHEFLVVEYKYFHNLFGSFTCILFFLIGTACVLYAIRLALYRKMRYGIWFGGIGTVMVVLVLFWLAGYFNTAYYPSYTDISSSLTIYNSSSSEFTLRTMSYVSIAIPFVIAYIVWVWYKLAKPQDDVAKKAE
jgi:cytochrome d ubiquinol oxidase subunit II